MKKKKHDPMKKGKPVSVEEFDKMVDEDEDLSDVLVPASIKPVQIDLPNWMIVALDEEARRLNVARKALINIWLAERIESNQQVKKEA